MAARQLIGRPINFNERLANLFIFILRNWRHSWAPSGVVRAYCLRFFYFKFK